LSVDLCTGSSTDLSVPNRPQAYGSELETSLPQRSGRRSADLRLDVDLARNAAPMAAYAFGNVFTLVSARTGWVVVNPRIDLPAVCLK